jgi:hypothetical protein
MLDDKKDKWKLKLIDITDYLTLRQPYGHFPYRNNDYLHLETH